MIYFQFVCLFPYLLDFLFIVIQLGNDHFVSVIHLPKLLVVVRILIIIRQLSYLFYTIFLYYIEISSSLQFLYHITMHLLRFLLPRAIHFSHFSSFLPLHSLISISLHRLIALLLSKNEADEDEIAMVIVQELII